MPANERKVHDLLPKILKIAVLKCSKAFSTIIKHVIIEFVKFTERYDFRFDINGQLDLIEMVPVISIVQWCHVPIFLHTRLLVLVDVYLHSAVNLTHMSYYTKCKPFNIARRYNINSIHIKTDNKHFGVELESSKVSGMHLWRRQTYTISNVCRAFISTGEQ